MTDFNSVKSLNLPKWKFAIFWSSVLAVRNIRPSDDIDILVEEDLRESLAKQYPDQVKTEWHTRIEIGEVEIMKSRIHMHGQEKKMINNAEIIEGLPFVRREYYKQRKEKMGREKDRRDLELLTEYERRHRE